MSVRHLLSTATKPSTVKKLGLNVLESWGDDETCESALHIASANPTHHILKYLLSTRISARVNYLTIERKSALHIAVDCGLSMNVKLLLKCNKTFVDPTDHSGNTPLHAAVCAEHLAIIDNLLKCGADASLPNCQEETPLQMAIKQCLQAVPIFRQNGTSLHEMLLATASFGSKALFQSLVEESTDSNLNDELFISCLFYAIAHERRSIVKFLLTKVCDLNRVIEERVPLVQAALFGMKDVVMSMVDDLGASDMCDAEGLNAVVCACMNDDVDLLSYLLERGFSVVSNAGVSALQHCLQKGHVFCTKMCLESGVSVHDLSVPQHVSSEELSLLSAAGFLLSREKKEMTNGKPGSLLDFCRIAVKSCLPLHTSNALSLAQHLSSSSHVQHAILFGKN